MICASCLVSAWACSHGLLSSLGSSLPASPPLVPARSTRPGPRRGRGVRARTMAPAAMRKELGKLPELEPGYDADRPASRADCQGGQRPCPWVACKHHLYLDVNPETGSVKLNFPDLEPWELAETCVLDVADRGGITLEEVGEILNLTRERIRQVEVRGLLKLKIVGPGEEPLPGDPGWVPRGDD